MFKQIEKNGLFPTENKEKEYTLLFDSERKFMPWAIVWLYDSSKEYGSQWAQGHYFENVYDAVAFMMGN